MTRRHSLLQTSAISQLKCGEREVDANLISLSDSESAALFVPAAAAFSQPYHSHTVHCTDWPAHLHDGRHRVEAVRKELLRLLLLLAPAAAVDCRLPLSLSLSLSLFLTHFWYCESIMAKVAINAGRELDTGASEQWRQGKRQRQRQQQLVIANLRVDSIGAG